MAGMCFIGETGWGRFCESGPLALTEPLTQPLTEPLTEPPITVLVPPLMVSVPPMFRAVSVAAT